MKQELIWELMKQAGELAYAEHTAKCLKEGLDPEYTVWSVTGAHYEKFALLIVAECTKVIDDGRFSAMACEGNSHRISYNNGIYYALSSVKKHFGVEL